MLDPWGRPYAYLKFPPSKKGVPVNYPMKLN
jgi:hypothetical protein